MKINDLVDCVYYINLDKRKDRREQFWKHNGIFLDKERTVRIPAFDASNKKNNTDFESIINARSAISLSYIHPFIHAQANGFNEILIFEDDAEPFFEDLNVFKSELNAAKESDYEILFLGGTVQSNLYRNDKNLLKLNGNILATQAVCFNNRNKIFDQFLNFPKDFPSMRKFLIANNGCCMDTIIGQKLTQIKKSFLTSKLLFGQYESFSDIEAKTISYNSDMCKRFKLFCNNDISNNTNNLAM